MAGEGYSATIKLPGEGGAVTGGLEITASAWSPGLYVPKLHAMFARPKLTLPTGEGGGGGAAGTNLLRFLATPLTAEIERQNQRVSVEEAVVRIARFEPETAPDRSRRGLAHGRFLGEQFPAACASGEMVREKAVFLLRQAIGQKRGHPFLDSLVDGEQRHRCRARRALGGDQQPGGEISGLADLPPMRAPELEEYVLRAVLGLAAILEDRVGVHETLKSGRVTSQAVWMRACSLGSTRRVYAHLDAWTGQHARTT